MTDASHALLAHESFARAVARGCLRDAHAVDDVLQETWTTALRTPRESIRSMRGWLAEVTRGHARVRVRTDARRAAREARVARPEAYEADASASAERLELRAALVRAVLALDEPYRTVVLLRYEEGLRPQAIARRTGASAATVRSQLARAHERLRQRLDAHDPQRRWAGLAAPLSARWLLPLVAGALVATAAAAVRWSPQPAARTFARAAVAQDRRAEPSPSAEIEIGDLDALDLRDFAVHVQREITRRALEVPERFYDENRELLAEPETGLARLIERGSPLSRNVLKREGGAYYSFLTLDHSYDRQPDLGYGQVGLTSGFYGGRFGAVVELGDLPLLTLPQDGSTPAGLDEALRPLWTFLNAECDDPRAATAAWWELLRERGSRRGFPAATAGRTYVVRTASTDEQDHLVAFRVLERDDDSIVIAWRLLRAWSTRIQGGVVPTNEFREVPTADRARSDELAALDQGGLLDLLSRLRAQAAPLLWEVPEELRVEFTRAVGPRTSFAQREGFTRILHRGRFGPLVTLNEGGYVYSFTTDSHDWSGHAQIGLEQLRYRTGFSGTGWILDLGALEFEDLRRVLANEDPSWANEDDSVALGLLRSARLVTDDDGRQELGELARALGLDDSAPAQLGHTYLLRSMGSSSDVLVAFTTLAVDEVGHTIAWRILESFPVR